MVVGVIFCRCQGPGAAGVLLGKFSEDLLRKLRGICAGVGNEFSAKVTCFVYVRG